MRWAGHVAHMREMRIAYRILVGKLKAGRPLGRSRCRWESSTKINIDRNGSGNCELVSGDSGYGQVEGCFRCGNERFVST